MFELLQIRIHGVECLSCSEYGLLAISFQTSMVGAPEKLALSTHQRNGQHTCKKGKTVDQANRRLLHSPASVLPLRALCASRERRLREIQTAKPAEEGKSIRDTIGIFDRRRHIFPRTVFGEIALQCLTTRNKAAKRIRQREARRQREYRAAEISDPATNLDPVVVLIVSLFTPPVMPNNRIPRANRAGTPVKR